jgi:DNA-binding transcriptional LysR family regulator
MSLDWQDLKAFAAVARLHSLSAAARDLGIDHATVGRRLDNLERVLDVVLVQRLKRGCSLTAAGAELAVLAAELEATTGTISRRARGLSEEIRGDVRISAPPAIASHCLVALAARLRQRHPLLRIVLIGETRLSVLGRQDADLALRLSRPQEPEAIVRRVGSVTFRPYADSAWLQATPASDWTFVGYDAPLAQTPQEIALRQLAGDRRYVFLANDVLSLCAAARDGLGIAMLPDFVAQPYPALVAVDPAAPPLCREIWLAVHADVRRSPAVRLVMDDVVATLGARFPVD